MSRIPNIEVNAVQDKVLEVFSEIENAFGQVPNLFRAYANHPPLLEANWLKVKKVMMEGTLSRKVKETIAVLVSKDNGCNYCVAAHETALQSVGISTEEIRTIELDLASADFTEKELALILFARKANSSPLQVTDKEVEKLRASGASNAEIVETLGVMELFTSFNKFLDSLQVEIDFEGL